MARILVTGASGFIGSHLVKEAEALGHEVQALSRRASEGLRWSLGDPLPAAALRGCDSAVHLAHDFDGETGAERTIDGTLAAIEGLRAVGVRRQLFFSSLSARPDATSLYGRTKLEIEQRIGRMPDVVIVRPGLVLGDGGIYGRIRDWVHNWPVAPLPDGGHGAVRVIDVETLCRETISILTSENAGREFDLCETSPKSLRDLVQSEARQVGKQVLILPIPSKLLLCALSLAERLHIPMPVKADNLAGFLANRTETPR